MSVSRISFAGFDNCIQWDHAGLKLIATTEVGPRILYFGRTENLLNVKKEHEGLKDGQYHSYGGHRLWVAPEDRRKTYTPDSFPVEETWEDESVALSSPIDDFHVQKTLSITPIDDGFLIGHTIVNHGVYAVKVSPWAVTVMRPGGTAIVPQHPVEPQGDETLLPVQPLVLWSYTDMTDSRFTWGRNAIQLRSSENDEPTKFGTFVSQGLACYSIGNETFIKRFSADETLLYPDGGCNFESYTRKGMLEVESLGPVQVLQPGESTEPHFEEWYIKDSAAPTSDSELGSWLEEVEAHFLQYAL